MSTICGKVIQDYITVKKVNEEFKLNVNSYIGRTEINKTEEKNGIKIDVLSKDTYMDYEKYNISVRNDTDNNILLDANRNIKSMYIQDKNGVKYSAYKHELSNTDFLIRNKHQQNLTVKYYSSYNSEKRIQYLVFSEIVFNYDTNTKVIRDESIEQISVEI